MFCLKRLSLCQGFIEQLNESLKTHYGKKLTLTQRDWLALCLTGILITNSDLIRRVWEHKNKFVHGFTKQYNVTMLVHYEIFNDITLAAAREKRLKEWKQQWKIDLIQKNNPK